MALTIQLNPPGMVSTDEGYISSISVRSAGGTVVYTPDGNNQIGATGNVVSAAAANRLAGGPNGNHGPASQQIYIVTGS